MPSCAVATCKNTSRTKKSALPNRPRFHKFRKGLLGQRWKYLCKRNDKFNLDNAVVCSDHFIEDNYERNLKAELLGIAVSRKLKDDAEPSLYMPHKDVPAYSERQGLVKKRRHHELVQEIMLEGSSDQVVPCLRSGSQIEETTEAKLNCSNNTDLLEFLEWKRRFKDEKRKATISEKKILNHKSTVRRLNSTIQQLKRQVSTLSEVKEAREKNEQSISKTFSSKQLEKLKGKNVRWELEDIVKALALLSMSRRAYRVVRSWNIPLPSERTINRWLHKFQLYPGLISPVLHLMKEQSNGMTIMEKLCIVYFDEMSIAADMEWDKTTDTIYVPHSKVQVVMAAGICFSWRGTTISIGKWI
ncbi:unnamed protein product [Orchesella dallaii]|uniref:THAP-type domain-containing protein n=1 Tax=Orchesella dallaii TaxID=48710 RepID=A0ABP1PU97_9HEXA